MKNRPKLGEESDAALAARILADPSAAANLTTDAAIKLAGVLATALMAVQAHVLRVPAGLPTAPARFADRLTVTTTEAADWLGLEEAHVQDLCRRGEIVASKPGKAYLIRVNAIREWLERQEEVQRDGRGAHSESLPRSRRPEANIDALPRNSRRVT